MSSGNGGALLSCLFSFNPLSFCYSTLPEKSLRTSAQTFTPRRVCALYACSCARAVCMCASTVCESSAAYTCARAGCFEDPKKIIRPASQTEVWICLGWFKSSLQSSLFADVRQELWISFFFLYHNMLTLLLAVLIFHLFPSLSNLALADEAFTWE